jgi:hypothetical protein
LFSFASLPAVVAALRLPLVFVTLVLVPVLVPDVLFPAVGFSDNPRLCRAFVVPPFPFLSLLDIRLTTAVRLFRLFLNYSFGKSIRIEGELPTPPFYLACDGTHLTEPFGVSLHNRRSINRDYIVSSASCPDQSVHRWRSFGS